jgi:O-antigen/teichoic acid export membrane protein
MSVPTQSKKDFNFMLKVSGFAGASKLSNIFFRYATSAVLTRILGADTFGIFVLGRTIVQVASLISQMGMGLGAVRQIAYYTAIDDEHNVRQTVRISLLVSAMTSLMAVIVLWLSGNSISGVLFKKPGLAMPLRILIFSIPFITLSNILLEILRGFKQINLRVWMENYFLPLSNLLLILVFNLLGFRLEGVIAAFILSNFLTCGGLFMINRKRIKVKDSPFLERKAAHQFFKFSTPLMAAKIFNEFRNRLDILLLGFFSTAANIGIFFIAFRLATLMSVPWHSFNMIFAPMVSGYFAQGDIRKIEYHYKNITKLMFILSLFFWGFLLIFSHELLAIFGRPFQQGAAVVILICFGQLAKTMVGHAGPMLAMIGKPSLNLIITVITLILLASLNLLLIPRLGIIGAGIANMSSVTVTSALELLFIYRFLKIHPFRADYVKPVFAALVSGLVVYLLKGATAATLLTTIGLMMVFTLLFFSSLYLQKLTPEEIGFLKNVKEKVFRSGRGAERREKP